MRLTLVTNSRCDSGKCDITRGTEKAAPAEYPVVVAEISKFDPKPVDSVVVPELMELEKEDVVVWADERLCEIISALCAYGHMLPKKHRKRFEQLCDEARTMCGEE